MNEVKEMVVDACRNVLLNLAATRQTDKENLKVRIDLKDLKEKPVFGLFNESGFMGQCELKEIIHAGGGKGLSTLVGSYIRSIIRDIFSQTMKQIESTDSKELFLLLYLKKEGEDFLPMLAVYYKKEFIWSMLIADAVASDSQIKQ